MVNLRPGRSICIVWRVCISVLARSTQVPLGWNSERKIEINTQNESSPPSIVSTMKSQVLVRGGFRCKWDLNHINLMILNGQPISIYWRNFVFYLRMGLIAEILMKILQWYKYRNFYTKFFHVYHHIFLCFCDQR